MKGLKKKEHFKPYGLDLKYEFNTYRQVGRNYGDRKTAHMGLFLNFMRWRRKRKNRREGKYKFCNTYSDWERHVQEILPMHIQNYEDMLHYLLERKSGAEEYLEIVKILLIPIYLSLVAFYQIFLGDEILASKYVVFHIVLFLLIILLSSMVALCGAKMKVNFYHDFLKIAEKMKKAR